MKTYLQMDGHTLVEYVEKKEYDLLAQERADFGALVDKQERELQNVVTRMEDVSIHKLEDLFLEHATDWTQGLENVRTRLIQAAKGEQP